MREWGVIVAGDGASITGPFRDILEALEYAAHTDKAYRVFHRDSAGMSWRDARGKEIV